MAAIGMRTLGRSGRTVSEVGIGGAALSEGLYGQRTAENEAIAALRLGVELGITYIDTSPGYGQSEERIGRALEGLNRDALFLATKTGTGTRPKDYSREGTLRSVERSLQLLKTDRIDLLQIHDPAETDLDLAFNEKHGALAALLDLKEQGIIGAIGIGVRQHTFLQRAIQHDAFDTILTYADFNLARQTARPALFEAAAAHGVAIIIGSPLLFGYLSDRPWPDLLREHNADDSHPEAQLAKRVRDWCQTHNQSTLAMALQYPLRENRISTMLIGARTPQEMEQNHRALSNPMAPEIWQQLEADLGIA
ncbi:MAG: hypothetical protein JWN98_1801 [Abditibacteriota bacterium]|nr:hypothetical protein [Abditibacteriota bacterium]